MCVCVCVCARVCVCVWARVCVCVYKFQLWNAIARCADNTEQITEVSLKHSWNGNQKCKRQDLGQENEFLTSKQRRLVGQYKSDM